MLLYKWSSSQATTVKNVHQPNALPISQYLSSSTLCMV